MGTEIDQHLLSIKATPAALAAFERGHSDPAIRVLLGSATIADQTMRAPIRDAIMFAPAASAAKIASEFNAFAATTGVFGYASATQLGSCAHAMDGGPSSSTSPVSAVVDSRPTVTLHRASHPTGGGGSSRVVFPRWNRADWPTAVAQWVCELLPSVDPVRDIWLQHHSSSYAVVVQPTALQWRILMRAAPAVNLHASCDAPPPGLWVLSMSPGRDDPLALAAVAGAPRAADPDGTVSWEPPALSRDGAWFSRRTAHASARVTASAISERRDDDCSQGP